jgi:hypothetical protein
MRNDFWAFMVFVCEFPVFNVGLNVGVIISILKKYIYT